MCIRDRYQRRVRGTRHLDMSNILALLLVALLQAAAVSGASGVLDGPTEGVAYTTYDCSPDGGECVCTKTKATTGWDGSCAAGYYCPYQNATALSCNLDDTASNPTQGLYCPANTQTPIYCCAGYYCPTNTEIIPCGKGNFCKEGAIAESSCPFGTACPEKTSNPKNTFLIICLFLVLGITWYVHSKITYKNMLRLQGISDELELEEKLRKQNHMTREQFTNAGGKEADFNRMDANGDGILMYEEMVANQKALEKADNKSNVVEAEEGFSETFDFKFNEIGLTLPNGITIMKGVTGRIRHGKVTAVMGPSGAGKTTFLNLLSGKAQKTHGEIYIRSTLDGDYNLEPEGVYKYRKLVGFVPQEDTMLRRLRVYDNIYFSGAYRLPGSWSGAQIAKRTEEVIKTLGLSGVAFSPIGDETLRGISGGQRKRVNIGMEVVANPRILFLDEPTSGLDSTSSQEVLQALSTIAAKEDMTIVTVIHQPRLEIYKLIDELLLLGKGGLTVYIGPREEAETYFAGLGFECEDEFMNPIDFFMDIISGDVPRNGFPEFVKEDLFEEWEKYAAAHHADESDPGRPTMDVPEMGNSGDSIETSPPAPKGAGTGHPLGADGTEASGDSSDDSSSSDDATEANEAAPEEEVQVELELSAGDVSEEKETTGLKPADEDDKPQQSCCSKCCGCFCEFFIDIANWWKDFFSFLYNCFIAPWCPGYRSTPGAHYVFFIVFQRSLRQQFRNFGSILAENILHLVLGLFLSTIASAGVELVGPIPNGAVDTCPYTLTSFCTNPLRDDYLGIAGFLCWAIGFAGIAVGSGTFGNEKPQFWREQGSGMNFVTYYYAKVVADLPKIALAAACFTFAFLSGFATNSTTMKVYAVVVAMYYAGFSLGYLVSAFVDQGTAALLGVAVSMLFAIALSGSNSPKLSDVHSSNGFVQGIFFMSYARWGTEAFYVNEVRQYDYMNINTYINTQGFTLSDEQYHIDIRNCFLQALIWQVIALVFLKMNDRQRQK
eukprot:TRINITY_DN10649_c0_g3_i1.p1 TRINITY_DN10649_c0_g3~~TRINITY_DN10649_c0_g3_i1.p1  ORF type:complete len:1003 (-),score=263.81 TRINITY_DN10649_c0_g3_i1:69-3077(-)